jgi:hypothetical protein
MSRAFSGSKQGFDKVSMALHFIFRCISIGISNKQSFSAGIMTGQDLQGGLWHAKGLGQELNAHLICSALYRRGRELYLEGISVASNDRVLGRSGLDVDPESDPLRMFFDKQDITT